VSHPRRLAQQGPRDQGPSWGQDPIRVHPHRESPQNVKVGLRLSRFWGKVEALWFLRFVFCRKEYCIIASLAAREAVFQEEEVVSVGGSEEE